eukprot:2019936-Alexandrium_andersonii.AAC.1
MCIRDSSCTIPLIPTRGRRLSARLRCTLLHSVCRPPGARGTARRSRPAPSLGRLLRAVPRAVAPTRPIVGGPLA